MSHARMKHKKKKEGKKERDNNKLQRALNMIVIQFNKYKMKLFGTTKHYNKPHHNRTTDHITDQSTLVNSVTLQWLVRSWKSFYMNLDNHFHVR